MCPLIWGLMASKLQTQRIFQPTLGSLVLQVYAYTQLFAGLLLPCPSSALQMRKRAMKIPSRVCDQVLSSKYNMGNQEVVIMSAHSPIFSRLPRLSQLWISFGDFVIFIAILIEMQKETCKINVLSSCLENIFNQPGFHGKNAEKTMRLKGVHLSKYPTIESHGCSMQIQAALRLCVVHHYCYPCRNDNPPAIVAKCQMDGPKIRSFGAVHCCFRQTEKIIIPKCSIENWNIYLHLAPKIPWVNYVGQYSFLRPILAHRRFSRFLGTRGDDWKALESGLFNLKTQRNKSRKL